MVSLPLGQTPAPPPFRGVVPVNQDGPLILLVEDEPQLQALPKGDPGTATATGCWRR